VRQRNSRRSGRSLTKGKLSVSEVVAGSAYELRRRLGEAIVIVLSILLAFGIEAFWDEHQERTEEEAALLALEAEFSANLVQLDTVIARHEAGRELMAMLAELSDAEIRALDQAMVSEIMLATANPWTFDPVLGTTDALVGAGRLDIIQDVALREALTSFKNFVGDTEEDVAAILVFAYDVWRAQIRHGGPWGDPGTEVSVNGPIPIPAFVERATPEDLLSVRSDPQLMGLVGWFHLNAGYYLSELGRVRDQIEVILELTSPG
jgi:hypothetical protein